MVGGEQWLTPIKGRKKVVICDCCKDWIYEHEEYTEVQGYNLCESCAGDVDEILKLFRASKCLA